MPNDTTKKIMEEYVQKHTVYSEFCIKTEGLIKDLLKANDIVVSSITSRVKEEAKLYEKLNRPNKGYSNFNEVTDIAGVRIVTYYSDDVDVVAGIISNEFEIDWENSVDKRASMEPDQFGYLSVQYIAKISKDRSILAEYKPFSDCQVEIQMRSILQHAWAENEHDTGYKAKEAIPRETRRYFSRLAGLLEIADSEFVQIRKSLQKYEQQITPRISETPKKVLINKVSLNIFIKNSPLVGKLDKRISIATNSRIKAEETNSYLLDDLINKIKYVGLENIDDLNSSLLEFGDIIVNFTSLVAGTGDGEFRELPHGICISNLIYVKVVRNKSPKKYFEYLEKFEIGDKEKWEQEAKFMISKYKQVS